jgi:catechol-2,3-dioxygenase
MQVASFDHYNLRAARVVLDALCAFYRDVIGLEVGPRPPFRHFGYWLYAGGRPVLHLSEADRDERREPGETTFSHAAFNCQDRAGYERRLAALGIDYRTAHVPLTGQVQLFFHDPAGNGVELNFAGEGG